MEEVEEGEGGGGKGVFLNFPRVPRPTNVAKPTRSRRQRQ